MEFQKKNLECNYQLKKGNYQKCVKILNDFFSKRAKNTLPLKQQLKFCNKMLYCLTRIIGKKLSNLPKGTILDSKYFILVDPTIAGLVQKQFTMISSYLQFSAEILCDFFQDILSYFSQSIIQLLQVDVPEAIYQKLQQKDEQSKRHFLFQILLNSFVPFNMVLNNDIKNQKNGRQLRIQTFLNSYNDSSFSINSSSRIISRKQSTLIQQNIAQSALIKAKQQQHLLLRNKKFCETQYLQIPKVKTCKNQENSSREQFSVLDSTNETGNKTTRNNSVKNSFSKEFTFNEQVIKNEDFKIQQQQLNESFSSKAESVKIKNKLYIENLVSYISQYIKGRNNLRLLNEEEQKEIENLINNASQQNEQQQKKYFEQFICYFFAILNYQSYFQKIQGNFEISVQILHNLRKQHQIFFQHLQKIGYDNAEFHNSFASTILLYGNISFESNRLEEAFENYLESANHYIQALQLIQDQYQKINKNIDINKIQKYQKNQQKLLRHQQDCLNKIQLCFLNIMQIYEVNQNYFKLREILQLAEFFHKYYNIQEKSIDKQIKEKQIFFQKNYQNFICELNEITKIMKKFRPNYKQEEANNQQIESKIKIPIFNQITQEFYDKFEYNKLNQTLKIIRYKDQLITNRQSKSLIKDYNSSQDESLKEKEQYQVSCIKAQQCFKNKIFQKIIKNSEKVNQIQKDNERSKTYYNPLNYSLPKSKIMSLQNNYLQANNNIKHSKNSFKKVNMDNYFYSYIKKSIFPYSQQNLTISKGGKELLLQNPQIPIYNHVHFMQLQQKEQKDISSSFSNIIFRRQSDYKKCLNQKDNFINEQISKQQISLDCDKQIEDGLIQNSIINGIQKNKKSKIISSIKQNIQQEEISTQLNSSFSEQIEKEFKKRTQQQFPFILDEQQKLINNNIKQQQYKIFLTDHCIDYYQKSKSCREKQKKQLEKQNFHSKNFKFGLKSFQQLANSTYLQSKKKVIGSLHLQKNIENIVKMKKLQNETTKKSNINFQHKIKFFNATQKLVQLNKINQ